MPQRDATSCGRSTAEAMDPFEEYGGKLSAFDNKLSLSQQQRHPPGRRFHQVLNVHAAGHDQPNAKQYTSTPASRNSISNRRSVIGAG